ncbi:MAG: hypothetical protein A2144_11745 [Chloroflexi bacterium RBG_16_50_9]|nr:MAG: hypothetical protein A2144_11745 [Chloroflexi bacterium RBG_16_50_9]
MFSTRRALPGENQGKPGAGAPTIGYLMHNWSSGIPPFIFPPGFQHEHQFYDKEWVKGYLYILTLSVTLEEAMKDVSNV